MEVPKNFKDLQKLGLWNIAQCSTANTVPFLVCFFPLTFFHTIRHVCKSMWPTREAKPHFGVVLVGSVHDCETHLFLSCLMLLSSRENVFLMLFHFLRVFLGLTAARNMLSRNEEINTVPFFWTMMFGKSVRYAGTPYRPLNFHYQSLEQFCAAACYENWQLSGWLALSVLQYRADYCSIV